MEDLTVGPRTYALDENAPLIDAKFAKRFALTNRGLLTIVEEACMGEAKLADVGDDRLSTILTFAGFKIVDPKDYPEFKRRVKVLYALRSKAIHRAEFGHVEKKDLSDLSNWAAWIVISMVVLTENGYKTLRQIHEQTSRLDKLSIGLSK